MSTTSRARWAISILWLCAACDSTGADRAVDAQRPDGALDAAVDASVDAHADAIDAATDAAIDGHSIDASIDAAELDASSAAIAPATPEQLTRRSALDYGDNDNGIITTSRLLAWLDDWAQTRPDATPGDLVILQRNGPGTDVEFVRSGDGVRVYDAIDLSALIEPRSNGLVSVGGAPSHGLRVDNWLRRYGIRADHDFVLLVANELSPSALEELASAWLALRYWGVAHEALGIYNGSVAISVPTNHKQATAIEPPYAGATRVSDLRNDHFALLADIGVVRAAIGRNTIIDVRSADEHRGATLGTSARDTTCLLGAPQCTPAFSGRIATALHLPWQQLIDDVSFTIRPLVDIDEALQVAGIERDATAIVYDGDRAGAALVSFVLLAAAGVPARWYGASFFEWAALNATHPTEELRLLSRDSPWRTDVFPTLSQHDGVTHWAEPERIARPLVFDAFATSADRPQRFDRQYKQDPPPLPAVGTGGNDCL